MDIPPGLLDVIGVSKHYGGVRGGLVDEAALVSLLREGHLGGAEFDVFG